MSQFLENAKIAFAFFGQFGLTAEDMSAICKNLLAELASYGFEYKPMRGFSFSRKPDKVYETDEVCRFFAMSTFDFLIRENREIPQRLFTYMVETIRPTVVRKLRKMESHNFRITDSRIEECIESVLSIAYCATEHYRFIRPANFRYKNGFAVINGETFKCDVESTVSITEAVNFGYHIVAFPSGKSWKVGQNVVRNSLRTSCSLATKHFVRMVVGEKYKKGVEAVPLSLLVSDIETLCCPEVDIEEFMNLDIDKKIKAIFAGVFFGKSEVDSIAIASEVFGEQISRATFFRHKDEAIDLALKTL